MGAFLSGVGTAFVLGFVYFLSAIPAGVVAGLPIWCAALGAWLGYSAGAGCVIVAGAPVRNWLVRKLRIPIERDSSKWIWKIWNRWGLIGLGIFAPVTIGPQVGGILALAVGEKPLCVFLSLSLGVLPWCILFGVFAAAGMQVIR